MNSNFDKCLKMLLVHEGGYVNNPADPGGETNLGVTKRVWQEWVGHDVSEKEMRNLTPLMVSPLYKRKYWDACHADELISGLDYCVFDVAVNSGVGRAVKLLQSSVGATPDGGYGSITAALVKKAEENPTRLIELFSAKRLEFMQSLKAFPTFGKGWSRRVAEVKADALAMVQGISQAQQFAAFQMNTALSNIQHGFYAQDSYGGRFLALQPLTSLLLAGLLLLTKFFLMRSYLSPKD